MVSLHAGALSASANADRPVRLAANGPFALNRSDDRREHADAYDVWLKAFGQWGDQDADGGDIGFRYNLGGLTLGADKRLTDTVTMGVSYGQAKNNVKTDQGLSDGDIDSGIGSIYGDYFNRRLYVTGVFSYGGNQYDLKRNIVVGATTTSVTSSHDGRLYSGALGAGYYFQNGPWRLDPSLFLQYTRLDEEGFRERGGSAALIVEGRKTTLLVSTLGLRAARVIESGTGGRWIPEASLAWLHDYDIDDQMINASYVGAPDASFSIEGRTADRNGAVLGLGIGYQTQAGFSTLLKYNGELRDHFSAHSIIGELRFDF